MLLAVKTPFYQFFAFAQDDRYAGASDPLRKIGWGDDREEIDEEEEPAPRPANSSIGRSIDTLSHAKQAMPLLTSWCLGSHASATAASTDGSLSPPKPGASESKSSGATSGKKWRTDAQFILASIGSAVGLGNLLRFPNLAYTHGGFGFLL